MLPGSFGQSVSEEKILKNRPIRNKNCLWRPCLLMDRNEISNLYRGPSIDASYQVSDQLALQSQRRRLKCEKLTDDGCKVMTKAHMPSHGLWQGELKRHEGFRQSLSLTMLYDIKSIILQLVTSQDL